jgi:hypothetical protein
MEGIADLCMLLKPYAKTGEPFEFVTEAETITKTRRIDLFVLDNGDKREYETDSSIINFRMKGEDINYTEVERK